MASTGPGSEKNVGSPIGEKAISRQRLLAALTATDVTVRRLDQFLSTTGGEERALALINYVAAILHHLSASAPWIAAQTRLGLVARAKGRSAPSKTPSEASLRWKALSSLASETRYTLRLFGLIPLWVWGSETIKNPPADPVLHALTLGQVISNVVYQFLENAAYLASKGIISKRFIEKYGGVAKWDLWSIRGWFGHIFLQFFVLWRERVLRNRRLAAKKAAGGAKSQELSAEEAEQLRLEIRNWKKSLVNNVVWAPLCLHWCLEKGIGIPDSLHGLISLMAGAWGIGDRWVATGSA
ncbi:hypothetical protein N7468_003826 [Penicillium chermesinum]|uniref:Peroxin 11C n=1 Tax=Penicillium chermesinum TaxID=63820 RepID=A0A9W9P7H0_9EURO|nr:uncharacterized protein N7468_003826 [Penicillium chermesinum]KAJ5239207.1 hypothetical protein N7468_003826 [Penicillium chermesinum]KAJ6164840.1 hypothetical protein N7470_003512 [Penicillium chermesinum]